MVATEKRTTELRTYSRFEVICVMIPTIILALTMFIPGLIILVFAVAVAIKMVLNTGA